MNEMITDHGSFGTLETSYAWKKQQPLEFSNEQVIAVLTLILAFSYSIFAAGCTGDPDIQLTAENAGERIALQTGQALVITLTSNPTTDYSWHLADVNESILQLQGDPEFLSNSDLVGAGGAEVLRFEALLRAKPLSPRPMIDPGKRMWNRWKASACKWS